MLCDHSIRYTSAIICSTLLMIIAQNRLFAQGWHVSQKKLWVLSKSRFNVWRFAFWLRQRQRKREKEAKERKKDTLFLCLCLWWSRKGKCRTLYRFRRNAKCPIRTCAHFLTTLGSNSTFWACRCVGRHGCWIMLKGAVRNYWCFSNLK